MALHNFNCDDDLWDKFVDLSSKTQRSMTELLRDAIYTMVEGALTDNPVTLQSAPMRRSGSHVLPPGYAMIRVNSKNVMTHLDMQTGLIAPGAQRGPYEVRIWDKPGMSERDQRMVAVLAKARQPGEPLLPVAPTAERAAAVPSHPPAPRAAEPSPAPSIAEKRQAFQLKPLVFDNGKTFE